MQFIFCSLVPPDVLWIQRVNGEKFLSPWKTWIFSRNMLPWGMREQQSPCDLSEPLVRPRQERLIYFRLLFLSSNAITQVTRPVKTRVNKKDRFQLRLPVFFICNTISSASSYFPHKLLNLSRSRGRIPRRNNRVTGWLTSSYIGWGGDADEQRSFWLQRPHGFWNVHPCIADFRFYV